MLLWDLRRARGALWVIGSVGLVGCSSSDDGDGGIDSGVEPSKSIQDLTEEEVDQVCDAVEAYMISRWDPYFCRLQAVTVSALALAGGQDVEAACDKAFEKCGESPLDGFAFDCRAEAVRDECSAPLGEMESCFQAAIDEGRSSLQSFDVPACSEMQLWLESGGLEPMGDGDEEVETTFEFSDVPECAGLDDACFD